MLLTAEARRTRRARRHRAGRPPRRSSRDKAPLGSAAGPAAPLVSGDSVAKFEWVDGKRRKLDLGRSADAILAAMRRIRDWFTGTFDTTNFEVTVGDQVIRLRPKDKRMRRAIESFEFHPTKDLKAMRRVVVREPGGDSTTMRFGDHDPKYRPPEGAFSLTNPADVR